MMENEKKNQQTKKTPNPTMFCFNISNFKAEKRYCSVFTELVWNPDAELTDTETVF